MGCGLNCARDGAGIYLRIATARRWRITSTASGSWPVIFCHSRAKMLTGIVKVRYGRLYRFGQDETQTPSIRLKYRLAFQWDQRSIAAASWTVRVGSTPSSNNNSWRLPGVAAGSFTAVSGDAGLTTRLRADAVANWLSRRPAGTTELGEVDIEFCSTEFRLGITCRFNTPNSKIVQTDRCKRVPCRPGAPGTSDEIGRIRPADPARYVERMIGCPRVCLSQMRSSATTAS